MAKLIFFGHDAGDPAVQRRIGAFVRANVRVQAFTMRRGPAFHAAWDNVDLGETRDAAFGQRLLALARARPILRRHRANLAEADVFYARNLDMLALAHWARGMSGATAKLIYECLDVHRFLTRGDPLGAVLRVVERKLLADTDLVVVSSPAFVREYFERRHPGRARTLVVENRMPWGLAYGARPIREPARSGPIRIGWFGNLRCRRSLTLLLALAERFPERVRLHLRGAPALTELPDFDARVRGRANVSFAGSYAWPGDLVSIYADVDLVWAGDFHDSGANSKWLLPNRLYEGGYYAVPPIAPAESETGRWIDRNGAGFTLPEPLQETLVRFIEELDHDQIAAARGKLLAAPAAAFVQPSDELKAVLEHALAERVRG